MMAPDNRFDGVREANERKDVGADVDVQLHLLELGRRQLAGLVQNVFGDGELPGVVQQRGRFDRFQRGLVGDVDGVREGHGIGLHPPHVAVCDIVFGVNRHRERFDRREVQPIDGGHVAMRILEAPERRAERQVKDGNQRQEDDRREHARFLDEENQTERHRR